MDSGAQRCWRQGVQGEPRWVGPAFLEVVRRIPARSPWVQATHRCRWRGGGGGERSWTAGANLPLFSLFQAPRMQWAGSGKPKGRGSTSEAGPGEDDADDDELGDTIEVLGASLREIVVQRSPPLVSFYAVTEHGRRHQRRLVFCSDVTLSLRSTGRPCPRRPATATSRN